jgi:hypothetical protein
MRQSMLMGQQALEHPGTFGVPMYILITIYAF